MSGFAEIGCATQNFRARASSLKSRRWWSSFCSIALSTMNTRSFRIEAISSTTAAISRSRCTVPATCGTWQGKQPKRQPPAGLGEVHHPDAAIGVVVGAEQIAARDRDLVPSREAVAPVDGPELSALRVGDHLRPDPLRPPDDDRVGMERGAARAGSSR